MRVLRGCLSVWRHGERSAHSSAAAASLCTEKPCNWGMRSLYTADQQAGGDRGGFTGIPRRVAFL